MKKGAIRNKLIDNVSRADNKINECFRYNLSLKMFHN